MTTNQIIAEFDRATSRNANRRARSAHEGMLTAAAASRILRSAYAAAASAIALSILVAFC